MTEKLDISYSPVENKLLDLYLPDQPGFDTLIWFHGGSLRAGSRRDGAELGRVAAENGFGFASVEYQLSYPGRYPDYLLDAARASAFVQRHIKEYGGSGNVFISGQSAGAYITMMLCMNPAFLGNCRMDLNAVKGFISDSAKQMVHFQVLAERGDDSRNIRVDEAAPLYYASCDRAIKPLLLLWYTQDMPMRREESQLLMAALKRGPSAAVVESCELPGEHCAGSFHRDENGEFRFLTEAFAFMKKYA